MPKTFTCRRCLEPFDNEDNLDAHSQADPPCNAKTKDLEQEILHITQTQLIELKKRQKGVTVDDEARWNHTFRILFPDVPVSEIPSPCEYLTDSGNCSDTDFCQFKDHVTELGDAFSNPVVIDAFRHFAGQTLPSRITADIHERLWVQFMGQVPVNEAVLHGMIRNAIHEAFGEFLPGFMMPAPAPLEPIVDTPTPGPPTTEDFDVFLEANFGGSCFDSNFSGNGPA